MGTLLLLLRLPHIDRVHPIVIGGMGSLTNSLKVTINRSLSCQIMSSSTWSGERAFLILIILE